MRSALRTCESLLTVKGLDQASNVIDSQIFRSHPLTPPPPTTLSLPLHIQTKTQHGGGGGGEPSGLPPDLLNKMSSVFTSHVFTLQLSTRPVEITPEAASAPLC